MSYFSKLKVFLVTVIVCNIAFAQVNEILTGTVAEAVARPVLGVGATIAALIALSSAIKEKDINYPAIMFAIFLGALATKWNSIVSYFTSLF